MVRLQILPADNWREFIASLKLVGKLINDLVLLRRDQLCFAWVSLSSYMHSSRFRVDYLKARSQGTPSINSPNLKKERLAV